MDLGPVDAAAYDGTCSRRLICSIWTTGSVVFQSHKTNLQQGWLSWLEFVLFHCWNSFHQLSSLKGDPTQMDFTKLVRTADSNGQISRRQHYFLLGPPYREVRSSLADPIDSTPWLHLERIRNGCRTSLLGAMPNSQVWLVGGFKYVRGVTGGNHSG